MNEAGCADGESVPVPDDFMAELMEPCEEVGGMPVMGGAVLKEGDPVVILEGPFEGLAGILQGQTGEERVLWPFPLPACPQPVKRPIYQFLMRNT